jgi:hypothetical protein
MSIVNKILSQICWHEWSKWEPYEVKYTYVYGDKPYTGAESWQRRQCKECGKVQERKIRG